MSTGKNMKTGGAKKAKSTQNLEFATKINFDVGVISELDVNSFKNVLVLTGTQYSLEIFEKNIRPLIKTNVYLFSSISGNLTDTTVYQVVNYASDKNIDCIISIGVEAVLDCGRLTSLILSQGGFLHEYLPGGTIGPLGIAPIAINHITVPIMPAAGYEISSYAAFIAHNTKHMLISPYLIPNATFIDPSLMTNLPSDLWGIIQFDGFATAMMAYVSGQANPTSDAFALQALNSYATHARELLKDPSNIEHIKHAASASLNAFLAVNYSSTGAVHAIADVLSSKFGFRYGVALATVAPYIAEFCYNFNPERFDDVTGLLGEKTLGAQAIKQALLKLIKDFNITIPSLKNKISETEFHKYATECVNYAMRGNTRRMSVEDIEKLLRNLR